MTLADVVRWAAATLGVLLLFVASEVLDDPETLFPEVGALAVGLLVVPKRVWAVSSLAAPVLMGLVALLGVLVVRYVHAPMCLQLLLGFVSVSSLLVLSRSGLPPAISACLLPILTQSDSWLYPLTVFGVTALLVVFQWLLVRTGFREPSPMLAVPDVYEPSRKALFAWGICLLALTPVLMFFVWVDWRFAVAPPLVVTFVEFSTSRSGLSMRPFSTWLLLVVAAGLGSAARLLGDGLPGVVIAPMVFVLTLVAFRVARKPFAPAAAIALVPFILPASEVTLFALRIAVGAGALIALGTAVRNVLNRIPMRT